MLIRDLPGWPPDPGGAYTSREKTPTSTQEVIVTDVLPVAGNHLTFSARFEGKDLTYDFDAPDEETARTAAKVLTENAGKSLWDIGNLECPSS